MTLFRQLLVFITLIFFILFSGTLLVKLNVTSAFLENQLDSHAQDTATSLGLAIAPYFGKDDFATMETMMNAIFDKGYYQSITLVNLRDIEILKKNNPLHVEGVPQWFMKNIEMHSSEASVMVTSGWRQLGVLKVKSHPGYAYQSLWKIFLHMIKIYLLTGVAVVIIGFPLLGRLLKPLRKLEAQAVELCDKRYTIQQKLPKTRELRQVVVAMNSMVSKVKAMSEEQAETAERLRKDVYRDSLTGLGNRRYFMGQLRTVVRKDQLQVKGALLLIEAVDLAELNEERGIVSGDLFLQKIASIIQQSTRHFANGTAARLSGGCFAILLPEGTEQEASVIAASISQSFKGMKANNIALTENVGSIGGVCFEDITDEETILSEADRVLRSSQNRGPNGWKVEMLSKTSALPKGDLEWNSLFKKLLNRKEVVLWGQNVVGWKEKDKSIHTELFSRIRLASGEVLDANIFIPQVERLNCIASFDKIVIEKAILLAASNPDIVELAINISPTSLKDPGFFDWTLQQLANRSDDTPSIVFEFPEFSIVDELDVVLNFAREVKAHGCFVGVDHFGRSFHNFGYLNSLLPKYVKIDRAFTEELGGETSDSLFFIQALIGVAHSLDILVIAEGVEDEERFQILCDLNIDAAQGYYFDKPHQMKDN